MEVMDAREELENAQGQEEVDELRRLNHGMSLLSSYLARVAMSMACLILQYTIHMSADPPIPARFLTNTLCSPFPRPLALAASFIFPSSLPHF